MSLPPIHFFLLYLLTFGVSIKLLCNVLGELHSPFVRRDIIE